MAVPLGRCWPGSFNSEAIPPKPAKHFPNNRASYSTYCQVLLLSLLLVRRQVIKRLSAVFVLVWTKKNP